MFVVIIFSISLYRIWMIHLYLVNRWCSLTTEQSVQDVKALNVWSVIYLPGFLFPTGWGVLPWMAMTTGPIIQRTRKKNMHSEEDRQYPSKRAWPPPRWVWLDYQEGRCTVQEGIISQWSGRRLLQKLVELKAVKLHKQLHSRNTINTSKDIGCVKPHGGFWTFKVPIRSPLECKLRATIKVIQVRSSWCIKWDQEADMGDWWLIHGNQITNGYTSTHEMITGGWKWWAWSLWRSQQQVDWILGV